MPNSASSTATYTSLMRVTTSGRPYCQNLFDLFAALIIQHGLKDHRYRFRNIPNSFVFVEALSILGHLQFTHIMKKPDPLDPSRLIATKTTTTFSMAPNMARSLAQNFITSRLVENAIDPTSRVLKDKAIWVLTPKGKFVIQEFCYRAGVASTGIQAALNKGEAFNIVTLERLPDHDDMIAFARPNMTMAFKTMMAYLPMESLLADDAVVLGIEIKNLEEYQYTFFGSQALEWIHEYTTTVSKEEAEMVASEFVLYGWISQVIDKSNREHRSTNNDSIHFKTSKNTMYYVTNRGRVVLGWDRPSSDGGASTSPDANADTMENHETILSRQRALAARLKSPPSQSAIQQRQQPPSSSTKKTSALNEALTMATSSSATGTSSSSSTTPSISSAESSGDAEESSSPGDEDVPGNVLEGMELMEVNIPIAQDHTPPEPKPTQTDIDQVTEKLLMLRQPKKTQSRRGSSSRPSSIVDGIDFITSAPIEGVMDPNSHRAKLRQILEDPLLRLYFRDFLKSHFSEENLNIWVDYYTLRRKLQRDQATHKELLQEGYAIYNTYLSPNAPSEVNIDHALRQEIEHFINENFRLHSSGAATATAAAATAGNVPSSQVPFATSAIQPTVPQTIVIVNGNASHCLRGLLKLYDRVNEHICHIMAQDSVPKFVKTEKYRDLTIIPPKELSSRASYSQPFASDKDLDLSDLRDDLPDSP